MNPTFRPRRPHKLLRARRSKSSSSSRSNDKSQSSSPQKMPFKRPGSKRSRSRSESPIRSRSRRTRRSLSRGSSPRRRSSDRSRSRSYSRFSRRSNNRSSGVSGSGLRCDTDRLRTSRNQPVYHGADRKNSFEPNELKTITVDIKRSIPSGTQSNRRVHPDDIVIVRRPGEGARPLFDREEIKAGGPEDEERRVRTSSPAMSDRNRRDERHSRTRGRDSRERSRYRSRERSRSRPLIDTRYLHKRPRRSSSRRRSRSRSLESRSRRPIQIQPPYEMVPMVPVPVRPMRPPPYAYPRLFYRGGRPGFVRPVMYRPYPPHVYIRTPRYPPHRPPPQQ